MENLQQHFTANKSVGLKFIGQVALLMKEEGIIENNAALQKRISDAANHFVPKLEGYLSDIKNHPLFTEHKEAATPINERLNELALAVYNSSYFLQYCKQSFSVTGFLQHKLKYALPKFNLVVMRHQKSKRCMLVMCPMPNYSIRLNAGEIWPAKKKDLRYTW
jgi:hypothetical protein